MQRQYEWPVVGTYAGPTSDVAGEQFFRHEAVIDGNHRERHERGPGWQRAESFAHVAEPGRIDELAVVFAPHRRIQVAD